MNPPIVTIRKSPSAIKSESRGFVAFSYFDREIQRNVVCLPYHISTRYRLHEIAHCVLGHTAEYDKGIDANEYIYYEVEADIWAFEKMGRETIPIKSLQGAFMRAIELRVGIGKIFNACLDTFAKHGYFLEEHDRRMLWNSLKELSKSKKEWETI